MRGEATRRRVEREKRNAAMGGDTPLFLGEKNRSVPGERNRSEPGAKSRA